ncbi:hypothetical protein [Actinomadura parmotrematis]|uniref:Sensor domain-containing protein n=1 Tax=Actinomadura parmotrematis TaxID=2864039 RepID=A0ABS7FT08_9ACTN|nr:hypothetical protein [Actinomadura parmotrematis]MBW8483539.1 hypothetical protein [Actinomadura parmotrematis]
MARRTIACWTVPLAAVLAAAAGCGTETVAARQVAVPVEQRGVTAALVSQRDLPAGFYPAATRRVLTGLKPADPECARLIRVADADDADDLRGTGDVPQAHTAFYQPDVAVSVAEHVYRLPAGGAAAQLKAVRDAVAKCPALEMDTGDGKVKLHRQRLADPKGAKDPVAVRYAQGKGPTRSGLDIVMGRRDDRMMVVAAAGALDMPAAAAMVRAEARAFRKLADARP